MTNLLKTIILLFFVLGAGVSYAQWTTKDPEINPFDGTVKAAAFSEGTDPWKTPPNADLPLNKQSIIFYQCEGDGKKISKEEVFFVVPKGLSGGEKFAHGLKERFQLRVKWDQEETSTFSIWTFRNAAYYANMQDHEVLAFYRKTKKSNSLLVEFPAHGSDQFFEYSLAGANAAIKKVRQQCGGEQQN